MTTRKRKNYFHGEYRTKKTNRLNIINKMQETEQFCQSIGLEFENIICKQIDAENPKKLTENDIIIIKETQQKKISSFNEKTFKAMKAKDITNQSNEKYNVQQGCSPKQKFFDKNYGFDHFGKFSVFEINIAIS